MTDWSWNLALLLSMRSNWIFFPVIFTGERKRNFQFCTRHRLSRRVAAAYACVRTSVRTCVLCVRTLCVLCVRTVRTLCVSCVCAHNAHSTHVRNYFLVEQIFFFFQNPNNFLLKLYLLYVSKEQNFQSTNSYPKTAKNVLKNFKPKIGKLLLDFVFNQTRAKVKSTPRVHTYSKVFLLNSDNL